MGGMLAVLSGMFPLTACSYDEKAGWDKYALTMPVSRKQMVLSKYVLGLAVLFAGLLVSVIVNIVMKTEMTAILMAHCAFLAVGLFEISLLVPITFKLGTEKARIAIILCYLIPAFAVMILEDLPLPVLDEATIKLLMYSLPVAALCLCVVSAFVSMRIYANKEF